MTIAPPNITNVWTVSVYITAASPPVIVYNPVITNNTTIDKYKFHPNAVWIKIAPENKSDC